MRNASVWLQQAWSERGLLAVTLSPLAALHALVVATRRRLYRKGWLSSGRLDVPVIVVGNLVAGGAGKTPTVLALLRTLRAAGHTPGVISRGYGRRGDAVREVRRDTPAADAGDEPLLIRLRGDVPVVVGRDRLAAAARLRHLHPEVDVIVTDDGLQHLRLARDVQVMVFDERGAGNGWLLPAGPLREPLPDRLPPRTVVLYNATRPTTPLPGSLAERCLAGALALDAWWRGDAASLDTLRALRGRPLVAAAGLARPERAFGMLRDAGLQIEPLALPDHYAYDTLPWPAGTADVIVTEKDAVKLEVQRMGATRVWVATLDFLPDPRFDADVLRFLTERRNAPAAA